MLHVLFSSAQLWGSWCFYKMYKKQQRLLAMIEGTLEDPEPAVNAVEETKDTRLAVSSGEGVSKGRPEMELTNER
ncbi:hypothetical protein B0O99DRAFT_639961 [Bisporella sp. PMI_857]|nr:hypothetical protein B0O99DRAFT_639961 [Bisporella sp. PMI_857]